MFYNRIRKYIPWNVVEFIFLFAVFMIAENLMYGSTENSSLHVTTMLAGAALYEAIKTRRKLERGEYK